MITNGTAFIRGTERQRGAQREKLTALPHNHRSLTVVLMSAEMCSLKVIMML